MASNRQWIFQTFRRSKNKQFIMPRVNNFSCEPFRSWNRLEPRPRTAEFDKVLECGVHDALWMLTRQWQFGELKGDDTGSAIFAKILMQSAPLSRIKTVNGTAQSYLEDRPLEATIEDMPVQLNYKDRQEAAYFCLNCLDRTAKKLNVSQYDRKTYRARLHQLYGIEDISAVEAGDTRDEILSKAELLTNSSLVMVAGASARLYFDGLTLYQQFTLSNNDVISAVSNGNVQHQEFVKQALEMFADWFKKTHGTKFSPPANATAWMPQQLEYQFACALPNGEADNTVLTATEYSSGDLEWYTLDVQRDTPVAGLSGAATPEEQQLIKTELLTVIPREAKFAGAPNSRWWQFEDSRIDLGNISADTTDISKMIFTEYALLYNTDWLIVPYEVKSGTISEIRGIVVTDVFGEQSFVAPALQGETDNWRSWGMFNLSVAGDSEEPADTRLFIPPATIKTLESDPIEEVHFVRDEMTNSVWGIEVKMDDHLGSSLDLHTFAKNYQEYIAAFDEQPPAITQLPDAMYRYTLANTVPNNWIPFIPVHTGDSKRAVKLQRAAMPRLFKQHYSHVRPRTRLLREGLDMQNVQQTPYYIHEEEVPRAGVHLRSTYQRTRWYNGKIINWYGITKKTGRGEGSSGLQYDKTAAVK
jgi:hypothetical protein